MGVAFTAWSTDNKGLFPWNVSTNDGGAMEFRATGPDGFDRNPAVHFEVMSNELGTPLLLVCPHDSSRKAATNFHTLRPENVTYRLATGTNISAGGPKAVLVVCPIDGNILYSDGTVSGKKEEPDGERLGHPMRVP
jgi:hypothetical protein